MVEEAFHSVAEEEEEGVVSEAEVGHQISIKIIMEDQETRQRVRMCESINLNLYKGFLGAQIFDNSAIFAI